MKRSSLKNEIIWLLDIEYDLEHISKAELILKLVESVMSPPEYLPEPQYCEVTGKQLECKPVRKWEKE